MLCAQVHAVGDVLHGPQLEKQAQVHHSKDQQTEKRQKVLSCKIWRELKPENTKHNLLSYQYNLQPYNFKYK